LGGPMPIAGDSSFFLAQADERRILCFLPGRGREDCFGVGVAPNIFISS